MGNTALRTNEDITLIYNKYVDMVYKICFMMLKNVGETEDATQNVFIKYINYDKQFTSDEHIKAWLIVTAKNECKNMLKNWFRSKRTDLDASNEPVYSLKEDKSDVLDSVLSLEKKYRLPIYLYYFEGYSTSEISKILEINHSTVRTYMAKGREKLKIMLEEDGYEN